MDVDGVEDQEIRVGTIKIDQGISILLVKSNIDTYMHIMKPET